LSQDFPKTHTSPFEEVSLVIYNLPPLSNRSPAGLKHPELETGPLPAHLVTSGFHMTSVYELVLANGPLGWYDPSAFFLKGTTTNLNPVVGERFQEPWKLTYKFKESASNLLSIGAECAWNTVEGATIFDLQVASV
jgi:hypothetical protein